MKKAIIGTYFKTKEAAEEEICKRNFGNWEIIKFKKGYLVVSQRQLECLLKENYA